jgi:hypothetical protein
MPNHRTHTKPAAAVAVSLFALASAARGAVLCQDPNPDILIPATTAGVYVNLVTGVNAITPAGAPNWDINPWSTTLQYYFNNAADPSSAGAVAATAGGNLLELSGSATVSSAELYSTETPTDAQMVDWQNGSTGQYLGVRFWNESLGVPAINYGWIQVDTTTATGHPANIRRWCYEDSGAAITTGTTPVELQTFTVE